MVVKTSPIDDRRKIGNRFGVWLRVRSTWGSIRFKISVCVCVLSMEKKIFLFLLSRIYIIAFRECIY